MVSDRSRDGSGLGGWFRVGGVETEFVAGAAFV